MTATVLEQKTEIKTVMLPIDELKPHEKGSPLYLELLKQELLKDGVLKYPIIADEKTRVILDGMHRWLVLKSLGYRLIPVMLVDALTNPKIKVGKRRIHRYLENTNEGFTVKEVLSAGLAGNLMNPRSTRHFFPFSKFRRINYPLQTLGKGVPQDVSAYLARTTKRDCVDAIREWLDEITEEIAFLTNRKEEVERERQEFMERTKDLVLF
jgi:hypothetical protein